MIILTRDDVLIATVSRRGFIVGTFIVAAPLKLHGKPLFEVEVDKLGYSSYRPIPEVWDPLCDELTEEQYAKDMEKYNDTMAMIEAAKAGDQEALARVNFYKRIGWREPTEPPGKQDFWPVDLWRETWCWQCGGKKLVNTLHYRHCSERCRRESHREIARQWAKEKRPSCAKAREDRTCKVCGALFQSRRDDAQYCSSRCRVRAHRGGSTTAAL